MKGQKLIEVMRELGKVPTQELADLVFGEVVQTTPTMLIKVDNRITIDSTFFILSHLCQQHTAIAPNTGVVLWRGLQVGDKVRMLRVNQGQMYYVIEREVWT